MQTVTWLEDRKWDGPGWGSTGRDPTPRATARSLSFTLWTAIQVVSDVLQCVVYGRTEKNRWEADTPGRG